MHLALWFLTSTPVFTSHSSALSLCVFVLCRCSIVHLNLWAGKGCPLRLVASHQEANFTISLVKTAGKTQFRFHSLTCLRIKSTPTLEEFLWQSHPLLKRNKSHNKGPPSCFIGSASSLLVIAVPSPHPLSSVTPPWSPLCPLSYELKEL